MKNIHILPTPNESRLYYNSQEKEYQLCEFPKYHTDIKSTHNISITSDEKPKVGDWTLMFDDYGNLFLCDKPQQYLGIEKGHHLNKGLRKIILTTDQDLINNGVQAIDDDFLEWFVKNPSCEEVEVESNYRVKSGTIQEHNEGKAGYEYYDYKIIIPKEEPKGVVDIPKITEECGFPKELWKPKQETLEEAAERYVNINVAKNIAKLMYKEHFIEGVKWQTKRSYSKEDMIEAFDSGTVNQLNFTNKKPYQNAIEWFEEFNKNT